MARVALVSGGTRGIGAAISVALKEQGRLEEALACWHQALHLEPNHAEAHWNRALAWLLLGNFEQGWPEYEWRWQRQDAPRSRFESLFCAGLSSRHARPESAIRRIAGVWNPRCFEQRRQYLFPVRLRPIVAGHQQADAPAPNFLRERRAGGNLLKADEGP